MLVDQYLHTLGKIILTSLRCVWQLVHHHQLLLSHSLHGRRPKGITTHAAIMLMAEYWNISALKQDLKQGFCVKLHLSIIRKGSVSLLWECVDSWQPLNIKYIPLYTVSAHSSSLCVRALVLILTICRFLSFEFLVSSAHPHTCYILSLQWSTPADQMLDGGLLFSQCILAATRTELR